MRVYGRVPLWFYDKENLRRPSLWSLQCDALLKKRMREKTRGAEDTRADTMTQEQTHDGRRRQEETAEATLHDLTSCQTVFRIHEGRSHLTRGQLAPCIYCTTPL